MIFKNENYFPSKFIQLYTSPAPTCCRVAWFCGNKTHSNARTSEPDFGVRIPHHRNSDIPSGFVNNLLLHLKGLHSLGFSL